MALLGPRGSRGARNHVVTAAEAVGVRCDARPRAVACAGPQETASRCPPGYPTKRAPGRVPTAILADLRYASPATDRRDRRPALRAAGLVSYAARVWGDMTGARPVFAKAEDLEAGK